jgi:hypothetical protein
MNEPKPIADLLSLAILNGYYRIWQPFMKKYDCQTVAEIGISEGDNFELMIAHKPQIAVAIDPWIDDGIPAHNDAGDSQEHLDKMYTGFLKKVADKEFVRVYREYSYEAVKHFPDEHFDLVYIDGDHTLKGCLKDITDWYPKIKPGKFLTGDDYWDTTTPIGVKFGVIEAVNTFCKANKLSFYLIRPKGWAIIKPV